MMNLHGELLVYNSGCWYTLPEKGVELLWSSNLCSKRDEIERMFEGAVDSRSICWGVKDRRAILAYQFWVDSLEEVQCIKNFRNSLDISRSLVSCCGMSLGKGLKLWLSYNKKLLGFLIEKRYLLLCFDQTSVKYQNDLRRIIDLLGLTTNNAGQQSVFTDGRLRSKSAFKFDKESLPNDVLTVYDSLYKIYSEQVI